MMTVRELLSIAEGITSVAIYNNDDESLIIIADAISILMFLDNTVTRFQVVSSNAGNDIEIRIYIEI